MFWPEMTVVRQAAAALGWEGVPVQVRFGGEDAWVIARLATGFVERTWRRNEARPMRVEASSVEASAVRIVGAIVAGPARSNVVVGASAFAAYSPRAVLVSDGPGVLDVQVAAAMLEQGVVVASDDGVRLLSTAGPAQAGVAGAVENARRRLSERVHANLAAMGASLEVC